MYLSIYFPPRRPAWRWVPQQPGAFQGAWYGWRCVVMRGDVIYVEMGAPTTWGIPRSQLPYSTLRPILWNGVSSLGLNKSKQNSPVFISEGGRIWQVWRCVVAWFGGTQTGSYQTGSYQKGRVIPPKPKFIYIYIYIYLFIYLSIYCFWYDPVYMPLNDAWKIWTGVVRREALESKIVCLS